MTSDSSSSYIDGYVCRACNSQSIGIEFTDASDRRRSGWSYRVAVNPNLRVSCSTCGENVPPENWTFARGRIEIPASRVRLRVATRTPSGQLD